MNIPDSDQLCQAISRKKPLNTEFAQIDQSRLFMPEHLTQLYHTPAYSFLSKEQKLRYNQLFAMRSIEQLMTLEARFIELVLKRTRKSSVVRKNEKLVYCMQEMIEEERQHFQMFHLVNSLAEPSIYQKNSMYFARFTLGEEFALRLFTMIPGVNLFLLWILLVLEEFSTYISRQMLEASRHSPDSYEPNFVQVHREHLKDETRHVAICANLLTTLLASSPPLKVRANAMLLRKFMCDYMTPKRGGVRVIEYLVSEFPELASDKQEILATVRSQKQDKVIFAAVQNQAGMPFSHSLFQRHPDFRFYSLQNAHMY